MTPAASPLLPMTEENLTGLFLTLILVACLFGLLQWADNRGKKGCDAPSKTNHQSKEGSL